MITAKKKNTLCINEKSVMDKSNTFTISTWKLDFQYLWEDMYFQSHNKYYKTIFGWCTLDTFLDTIDSLEQLRHIAPLACHLVAPMEYRRHNLL